MTQRSAGTVRFSATLLKIISHGSLALQLWEVLGPKCDEGFTMSTPTPSKPAKPPATKATSKKGDKLIAIAKALLWVSAVFLIPFVSMWTTGTLFAPWWKSWNQTVGSTAGISTGAGVLFLAFFVGPIVLARILSKKTKIKKPTALQTYCKID